MSKTMRWTTRRARRERRSEREKLLAALAVLGYIGPATGAAPSIWDRYGLMMAACIGGALLLILPSLLGAKRADDREAG